MTEENKPKQPSSPQNNSAFTFRTQVEALKAERRKRRKRLGVLGETIATNYLTKLGWKIVARNFRAGRSSEIDLIALTPDGITVFIEVKTRTMDETAYCWYESATQCINTSKKKRIASAAQKYFASIEARVSPSRFDVIFIGLSKQTANTLMQVQESGTVEKQLLSYCGKADSLQIIHCEGAFMKWSQS